MSDAPRVAPADRALGVFDSGVGGLTVLRALTAYLPHEDFVYLGDTARLPYGTKSPATVARYSVRAAESLVAQGIKALPLPLARPRPVDEAISTAGGVRFASLDAHAMLRAAPGVFCAGEMLDWEAPTGGYLLTASMATGRWAAQGALAWLRSAAGVAPG